MGAKRRTRRSRGDDRILIATARELAATLVTRDREMLAYGAQGNVSVLACVLNGSAL